MSGTRRAKEHGDPEIVALLDELLLPLPGVTRRQMMGHPSYLVPVLDLKSGAAKPKMFCCALETGVVLKLPPARIEALLAQEGFSEFAPMADRPPMRGWIVLERESAADIESELALIMEAKAWVESGA
ncbi:hypothetical protein IT575_02390 [bacterium]|nr:hypothetical protein [bacterium]